jgi:hypothetical protein
MAAPAAAQTAGPPPSTAAVEFLPRFGYDVGIEHIFSEDPRFVWDAHFAADLDIIDYGLGRVTFVANYQAVLGSQFRAFDPNQGNYILEGAGSVRAGRIELVGVFHHVSRHLSDRPKRQAVDWNMIGGRLRADLTRADGAGISARADLRRVIQHTYVDYTWEFEAAAAGRMYIAPRVALVTRGAFNALGVDGTRDRGTQVGYRGEGGIRIEGRGAALELFLAGERRIDPYQLEFSTATWMLAGFRIAGPAPARMP